MIPVFKRLEIKDKQTAIGEIQAHINKLQTELLTCLMNLTSENVTELSSDITKITSQRGSEISGDLIMLKGANGETLTMGYSKEQGTFSLEATDKNGESIF